MPAEAAGRACSCAVRSVKELAERGNAMPMRPRWCQQPKVLRYPTFNFWWAWGGCAPVFACLRMKRRSSLYACEEECSAYA